MLEKPKCPVCGNDVKILHNPETFHCGAVRLLSKEEDHYLSFKSERPPNGWPKKGCPICGRPMQEAGRFQWLRILASDPPRFEGLERMHCDQSDHFCYVTKAWYDKYRL